VTAGATSSGPFETSVVVGRSSPPYPAAGSGLGADEPAPDARRLLKGMPADGRPLTLAGHLAVHGPLEAQRWDPADVVATVEAAGLLGRGGGRYALAAKLAQVAAAARPWRRPLVVVNAGSTEPAVRKDRVLVEHAPHLVLDGLAVAAHCVGAREAVVWLHRGQSSSVASVQLALDERAGGSPAGPRTRVVQGPPRYVAGEASATVRYLSGGPARPSTTPPHATGRGVDGRPTLVVNAETLAHLALVARHGPAWFRAVGPSDEPGTVLVTVAGAVGVPGVVEAAVGTSLSDLVSACGGWSCVQPPAGVLVGGYAGAWVPSYLATTTTFSRTGLAAVGAEPGAGLLHVLSPSACVAAETARLATWLARESAGQCGPCVNGLPAMAAAAHELAAGGPGAAAAAQRLERWTAMVEGRGACHHPDGVVRLVRSLLRSLPDEVDRHTRGPGCAGAEAHGELPLPAGPAQAGGGPWR
jgi:NADH:ubiquinone oxidoreductase subunit F (NADH-binding)